VIITGLKLRNFRNYQREELNFARGESIIFGKNASGKTNLLEAIYYLSHLKSFRADVDSDLVYHGKDGFDLLGDFIFDNGAHLEVSLSFRQGEKYLRANNVPVLRNADWFGRIPVYLFSPQSMELLWGQPQKRRELWDYEIARFDHEYQNAIITYRTALKARNKILKQMKSNQANTELINLLNFYTDSLVISGSKIIHARLTHLKEVLEKLPRLYHLLTKERMTLRARYITQIHGVRTDSDFTEIKGHMLRELDRLKNLERERGFTLIGPHRDDIRFYLNEVPLGQIASQGQVRSATIALILSLASIARKKTSEAPILLLDDALSELDDERKKNLIRLVSTYPQCIFTSASTQEVKSILAFNPTLFRVDKGKVTLLRLARG